MRGMNRWTLHGIARRQRGLVTTAQLLTAGTSKGTVRRRVQTGTLVRVHRGVFLLGSHPFDFPTRALAAVLACGPGTFASHLAAGFVWQMLAVEPETIDVSVVERQARARAGISTHERRRFDRSDTRIRDLVPVTSPSLTLLDLAVVLPPIEFDRAIDEARSRRLTSQSELAACVRRHQGHHGVGLIERVLRDDTGFSRSEAERMLLRLIEDAGLPRPLRNARVEGLEVDFLWPDLRLVVEMDGYRWHSSRAQLNRDRERDSILVARGYRVLRISYDQLHDRSRLIARLAATIALASRAAA
jgi:very-short-patch-repair endonuclease